ncbi:sodium:solute symporter family protein [Neptunomonas antarctica]|uniref:Na+/proline symporter n=1 Tax=Neptunomonas antarctica TaxID=619304 RepID=A0A1N7NPJ9_9GAMM|nr:sodium:solute symporter [Neptunomonas antarctica]SIT00221.1 Na+/proline symporter [Neptunomonas antarctica]
MFSPLAVISTVIVYMLLLFTVAQLVERRVAKTGTPLKSPWIYALSLAVFHTSWTFYGSVGFASTSGLLFLGIYVGALIGIIFWWVTLRKMVAIKETFRITSIADFISTRYRRSQKIAGLVTLIALIGILPYIALQLKAIVNSFEIITQDHGPAWEYSGLFVILIMTAFTIIFGVRKLDPTERHQGMIVALVVESIVKLVAFVSVGLFVCFILYDGPGDIYARMIEANLSYLTQFDVVDNSASMWVTLIILSFAGIYLLPRQFHVAVVENTDKKHIKTAMWLFPLYIIAINLFVVPLAAAGLMSGIPAEYADFFVLLLPQQAGYQGLTLFAFIGGFSAATGMIIITTMTLATMVSNHLLLPIIESVTATQRLRAHLLQIRWVLVALILTGSYWFEREFSDSYILVAIGLLSFVAILQFAPAAFGGMFWHRGNSGGAFSGLLAGFFIWCYTLGLPTFIKQGWLSPTILTEGPWGIEQLKPEALLGLDDFNPLTHSVIWTLLFNISFYIIGSLIYHPHKDERTLTTEFMAALQPQIINKKARPTGLDAYITLSIKIEEAKNLLAQYLTADKARESVYTIAEDLQVLGKAYITIIELIEFHRMIEHLLAGSIGAASAHSALEQTIRYSERESSDLKALYSHIVNELSTQSVVQKQGNEDADDDDDHLPNGFGMLSSLQSQIDTLEATITAQQQEIVLLETKLDTRYEEIFKYRTESQRIKQENDDLRNQANLLPRNVNVSPKESS